MWWFLLSLRVPMLAAVLLAACTGSPLVEFRTEQACREDGDCPTLAFRCEAKRCLAIENPECERHEDCQEGTQACRRGRCECLPSAAVEANCQDQIDDDCDGEVDCGDPDCADVACGLDRVCGPVGCVPCGLLGLRCCQNDACVDGLTNQECVEKTCVCAPSSAVETNCQDQLDDDCDGAVDCDDPDCANVACGLDRVCEPAACVPCGALGLRCCQDEGCEGGLACFAQQCTQPAQFDFDGDGRTDLAVFRPSTAEWRHLRSSDGIEVVRAFGTATDVIVPAELTGDGKLDAVVFTPATSEWSVLRSQGDGYFGFPFGSAGDVPAAGDLDGDGVDEVIVFRPSETLWVSMRLVDANATYATFGLAEDWPTIGDYDGDGFDDISLYRPSSSQWWQSLSGGGFPGATVGAVGDWAVPGDYNGDGKTDLATYTPSTGAWFISLPGSDPSVVQLDIGGAGDIPVPGDYDGDGVTDPAVWRPANGMWIIRASTAGDSQRQFGVDGDIPVPSAYVGPRN